MNIRFAHKVDLPTLVEIYNQAILSRTIAALEQTTLEERIFWFEQLKQDERPIIVAESEDNVAGYLYLSSYRRGRSALRQTVEVSYFVHEDHHRRGVGSQLMKACIESCPDWGIKSLFAILLETNTASINLLKKFGFQQWAHLPEVAEIDGVEVSQVYFGRKV